MANRSQMSQQRHHPDGGGTSSVPATALPSVKSRNINSSWDLFGHDLAAHNNNKAKTHGRDSFVVVIYDIFEGNSSLLLIVV